MKKPLSRADKSNRINSTKPQAVKSGYGVPELKITRLRECRLENSEMDNPEKIEKFWREHIETDSRFNPDVETLWVFLLNTRYNLIGFQQVSQGTRDTILVDPGLVLRAAVIKNAAAIVVAHNHPSGDPSPSEADIKTTRDLLRGGRFLKIELIDHIIFGSSKSENSFVSLRERGILGDESGVESPDKKEAAKSALWSAINDLETVTFESKSMFQLLANNFEYITHSGDIGHDKNSQAFTTGIYFLSNDMQDKLTAAYEGMFAAASTFKKLV